MLQKLSSFYQKYRVHRLGYLESRLAGFPVRVHPADRRFWTDTYFDSWEAETINCFRQNIKSGHSLCDIGAWVGPTSILAARLGAKVVCFEPDPVAYEKLLFNIRMNVPGSVDSFSIALGAQDGVRRLTPLSEGLGQSGSSLYGSLDHQESAAVLSLSWESAVSLLELPPFDFIKIDVEGAEAELLPAMLPWIRLHRPSILLSTHWRFIPEKERSRLVQSLGHLSEIYPESPAPKAEDYEKGFPSFFFAR